MTRISNDRRNSEDIKKMTLPNSTRPVWQDRQMTCEKCPFCHQDIDTFPCAKCHTRN